MIVLIGFHYYSESEPCSSALILSRYFVDAFGSLLDLLSWLVVSSDCKTLFFASIFSTFASFTCFLWDLSFLESCCGGWYCCFVSFFCILVSGSFSVSFCSLDGFESWGICIGMCMGIILDLLLGKNLLVGEEKYLLWLVPLKKPPWWEENIS